jgi:hypothetical protein
MAAVWGEARWVPAKGLDAEFAKESAKSKYETAQTDVCAAVLLRESYLVPFG